MRLTVGDLFAGAGGFAEGFRQAGYRILWGVDHWEAAAKTFEKNLPGRMIRANLLELRLDLLKPPDVVIGSPPCTQFSLANKGGNGNRKIGMRDVFRFLEVVRQLKPKYWIMENVPNLAPEVERFLDGDNMRLPRGTLEMPQRRILLASEYGTPQNRRRLFCGDYPIPEKSDPESVGDRATLGGILHRIPPPCHSEEARERVQDPVYASLHIPVSRLRAHFEDDRWSLTDDEIESCRRHKTQHRVYGTMPFPDRLDAPSRTITSTRVRTSRSTIVVPCQGPSHPKGFLRTITARECASAQAFPISFQFWGATMSDVDRMIGNAVPPTLAHAFAKAILRAEGLKVPDSPRVEAPRELAPTLAPRKWRRPVRYPVGRRFRGIFESEWAHNARVELDNAGANPGVDPGTSQRYVKQWVPRMYLGYAKKYKGYELSSERVARIIQRVVQSWPEGPSLEESLRRLAEDAVRVFHGRLPDATSLQSIWSGRGGRTISPTDILRTAEHLVNQHLPRKEWARVPIPNALYATTLTYALVEQGTLAEPGCPRDITTRMLGGILVLSIACDEVNGKPNPFILAVKRGGPLPQVAIEHGHEWSVSAVIGPGSPTRPSSQ